MEKEYNHRFDIHLELGNQRAVIFVDRMVEENCYCTWLASDPRIQGDGETFEQAIDELFNNIDFKRHMWQISDQIKGMKDTESWFNNPVEIL